MTAIDQTCWPIAAAMLAQSSIAAQETEPGGSLQVLSQPKLHGESKTSLGNIGRHCFRIKQE